MDKQGRPMVPMTGENYRPVPRAVEGEEAARLGDHAAQLARPAFAVYVAVQALEGKDIPAFVKVPLPIIDNSNIDEYLARAKDFPADGYIYSPYSLELLREAAAPDQ